MALVKTDSGCRVGWHYYDDEAEARDAAAKARAEADLMVTQGYDFGYVYPGGVERVDVDGATLFKVVVP